MENIILCEHCAKETSFERNSEEEPAEGNVCSVCGDWICDNCTDWNKSYKNGLDFICKDCANE